MVFISRWSYFRGLFACISLIQIDIGGSLHGGFSKGFTSLAQILNYPLALKMKMKIADLGKGFWIDRKLIVLHGDL